MKRKTLAVAMTTGAELATQENIRTSLELVTMRAQGANDRTAAQWAIEIGDVFAANNADDVAKALSTTAAKSRGIWHAETWQDDDGITHTTTKAQRGEYQRLHQLGRIFKFWQTCTPDAWDKFCSQDAGDVNARYKIVTDSLREQSQQAQVEKASAAAIAQAVAQGLPLATVAAKAQEAAMLKRAELTAEKPELSAEDQIKADAVRIIKRVAKGFESADAARVAVSMLANAILTHRDATLAGIFDAAIADGADKAADDDGKAAMPKALRKVA